VEVYTLGRTSGYDSALYVPGGSFKIGFRSPNEEFPEGYGGGWIWKDPKDADEFRLSRLNVLHPEYEPGTFSVYVIEITSWESDVSSYPDSIDGIHRLLNDSRILRKFELFR
jgi:hypothetical protein